ncbi:hypothetical protein [Streptomonospora litoralis]|uniref:Uncharacterized protein n=1 Tax=Streptomonospora litoralis TaxID=2498135 RepID=A0A4P6QAL0_9ACTN|nr:hypothetical protein [Streptomonospora litoralis]QBI56791.1 hypothetical protein EKD16_25250 [Streptomonospora litoralis]
MAVPDGATSVVYSISTVDDEPYLDLTFEFAIGSGGRGEIADAAAQAAADHVLAELAATYPQAQVRAERTYTGSVPGTTWPAPEEA